MPFLTKVCKSAQAVAAASFCTCIVASVCGQAEIADAAASVFWTSIATAIGTWAAEEIKVAVS